MTVLGLKNQVRCSEPNMTKKAFPLISSLFVSCIHFAVIMHVAHILKGAFVWWYWVTGVACTCQSLISTAAPHCKKLGSRVLNNHMWACAVVLSVVCLLNCDLKPNFLPGPTSCYALSAQKINKYLHLLWNYCEVIVAFSLQAFCLGYLTLL